MTTVGRNKYLTSIYKAYVEVGKLEYAKEIYLSAYSFYSPLTRMKIDKILGIKS